MGMWGGKEKGRRKGGGDLGAGKKDGTCSSTADWRDPHVQRKKKKKKGKRSRSSSPLRRKRKALEKICEHLISNEAPLTVYA